MTTIEEFNSAVDASTRRILPAIASPLAWFLGWIAVSWMAGSPIRAFILGHFGPTVLEGLVLGTLIPPALLLMFGGVLAGDWRDRRDPRLRCPGCGRALAGGGAPSGWSLAVATRNCGHCGERVLADPGPPPDPGRWRSALIAIDDLRRAAKAAKRREGLILGSMLLSLVLGMVGVLLARPMLRDRVEARFGPAGLEASECAIMVFPFLLVMIGGGWVNWRSNRRDPRLICPACGKSLKGMDALVIATKNCGHCGHRAVAAPD